MKILEFLKSLLNGNKTNKEEGKTSQDKLDELKNYVDSQYGSYMPAKKETARGSLLQVWPIWRFCAF